MYAFAQSALTVDHWDCWCGWRLTGSASDAQSGQAKTTQVDVT